MTSLAENLKQQLSEYVSLMLNGEIILEATKDTRSPRMHDCHGGSKSLDSPFSLYLDDTEYFSELDMAEKDTVAAERSTDVTLCAYKPNKFGWRS